MTESEFSYRKIILNGVTFHIELIIYYAKKRLIIIITMCNECLCMRIYFPKNENIICI